MTPNRIATGLWHWTARHPEQHPGEFGAEVGSYALEAGGDLLLIDPLLPQTDGRSVLDLLDGLAGGRDVHVLVTIGYHTRSAESLCERYGARVHGPPNCASRLRDKALLTDLEPGEPGPAGAVAHPIGRPRRSERPLWLPSHRAVAFGDAVVTTPEGDLRVWLQDPVDDKRLRWYRERFAPTLDPLLELPVERVLVTHGEPVLEGGATALRDAVNAEPWDHRGQAMVDRAHVSTTVYEALVSMWPGGFDREALTDDLSLRSDGLGLDAIEMVELHLREMLLNPAA